MEENAQAQVEGQEHEKQATKRKRGRPRKLERAKPATQAADHVQEDVTANAAQVQANHTRSARQGKNEINRYQPPLPKPRKRAVINTVTGKAAAVKKRPFKRIFKRMRDHARTRQPKRRLDHDVRPMPDPPEKIFGSEYQVLKTTWRDTRRYMNASRGNPGRNKSIRLDHLRNTVSVCVVLLPSP